MMINERRARAIWIAMAACGITLTGCADGHGGEAAEALPTAQSLGTNPGVDPVETALRDVETGRNLEASQKILEAVLGQEGATSDQRDDARLALSRLHELRGDKDAAVRVVEDLLASHRLDARYPAKTLAERRLRSLLTGKDKDAPSHRSQGKVAPVAKALCEYFPKSNDDTTRVQILIFGRTPQDDRSHGIFNIAGAMEEKRREACPLCTDSVGVNTSISQVSSWVSIPAALAADPAEEPSLASSMVVYYFDLESNEIPSRYDAHLPIASERIASRLRAGDGLIAVKVRDGAPPLVVLAAPRWAMLPEVEEAFSAMRALPSEPVAVPLSTDLRSGEIQSVVREGYPKLRACYETHLLGAPDAEGKIVMGFAIDGEGRAQDVKATEDSTLTEADLQRCFSGVFSEMRFPAVGKVTTVKYPVALSPSTR